MRKTAPVPSRRNRRRATSSLFNHLIRPLQKGRRDRQAEGLGGLEVDEQVVLGGLLDS
jgi:hypothetical protein